MIDFFWKFFDTIIKIFLSIISGWMLLVNIVLLVAVSQRKKMMKALAIASIVMPQLRAVKSIIPDD